MMKRRKFGRRILAFVVTLVVGLTTVSFSKVSTAFAASLKLTATGTMLPEGTKLTKTKVKKVLKVTKNGKKLNSYTIKQLNTTITGTKFKVTVKVKKASKSIYIKVNRIKSIYIQQCDLESLVEGSTFSSADFKKKTVVMAGYKKGGDQKINTYKIIPATETVTANSNGEFDVIVKYGKFKDKISIPVTKSSEPTPTPPSTEQPSTKPDQVTVTYKVEGTSLISTKVNVGESLAPPNHNLARAGKIFSGWQIGGTIYYGSETDFEFYDSQKNSLSSTIKSMTAKKVDVVVNAYYVNAPTSSVGPNNPYIPPIDSRVYVTYKSLEGNILLSQKVNKGDSLQPPSTNLSKIDKTFAGWQLTNTNVIFYGKESDHEFYNNNNNTLSTAIKDLTSKGQNVILLAYYVNTITPPQLQSTVTFKAEDTTLITKKVNAGEALNPPTENLSRTGKTFSGWQILNTNTIFFGKENDSEFYDNNRNPLSKAIKDLTAKQQDINIIAYYTINSTPTPTTQVNVSYQSAEGPVLTSSKVNAGETLKPPTKNLWRADKTFAGWRIGENVFYGIETDSEFYDNNRNPLSKAIKDLTAKQQDVNIIAYYTSNSTRYFSASIIGGVVTSFDGEKDSSGNFKANSHLYIKPEIPAGKYFGGWADSNGVIQSFEQLYDFYINTNIVLTAIYKDVAIEKTPVIHFTGDKYQLYPSSYGVRLFMAVEIPEGYKKGEWGFIFTGQTLSSDEFVLNGNRVAKVVNNGTSTGSADWTYDARFASSVWDTNTTVSFRIYLNYTAPNGEQHTVYSDILSVKLSK